MTSGPDATGGRADVSAPPRLATPEDRPLTWGERSLYQVARLLLLALAGAFWRIRVEGRENIPKTGPFVVAPVHRSNIDTVLMPFVTRRQMRYMAKDSLWKHGWSARLLTALGGFPVNRESADRESLRRASRRCSAGRASSFFPREPARREPR